jgi:hypothetical protein
MTWSSKLALCRRLLLLAVLSVCLGIALTEPPTQTLAAPCCQQCVKDLAVCENNCALQCEGSSDPDCYMNCEDPCYTGWHTFYWCGGWCVWCSYGGAEGGGGGASVCEFTGPQPAPAGGYVTSISCPNGYNGTCIVHPTSGEYCCDGYGCYTP